MIGALIGDIVGSRFEWNNCKSKDFVLFTGMCRPTDDSVMSLAVAKAILDGKDDLSALERNAIRYMQSFGRSYPRAGYGGNFGRWIRSDDPQPYGSYGNGAAMRVSACGFAADSLEEAKALSRTVTAPTHDHPESFKAAEAVSCAIWLAKNGKTMSEIKKYITAHYYVIDFTLDEIRPGYEFDVSCQGSVPQAFEAFFESVSFEDAIRNAVSIGGDSDTIGAITGSIADAYYKVPPHIRLRALAYLDNYLSGVLADFERIYGS